MIEREPQAPPPHAPSGGRIRRLLGPFYVTGSFWYRFHLFGVRVLPEWAIAPALFAFTSFFFLVLWRIRRAIGNNLQRVLGPAGWWRRQRRIFRTLHEFAWCLTERYERLGVGREMEAETDGLEIWQELQASPGGFLIVTAHLGHWEVGSLLSKTSSSKTVHVVREEEMDPEAQRFFRVLVARNVDDRLQVHFAGEDPFLGGRLLEALRRGEVVALQGDRPRAGGRTVRSELFGLPYLLPVGPLALARTAGVPLVPIFVYRVGRRRARVEFRRPLSVDPGGGREESLRAAGLELGREIERAIRKRPHQWFCLRDLWSGEEPGRRDGGAG